jgi:LytS/YehU family sensor histidine kinase
MAPAGMRTSRVVALSLVVGTFFTAQTVLMTLASGRPIDFQQDVVQELLYWGVWAFLTPVVLAAIHRWPLDAKPVAGHLAAHAVMSAVLAPTQTIIAFGLRPLALWLSGVIDRQAAIAWMGHAITPMVWGVSMGIFFYWVIVGVYTAFRFRGLYTAQMVSAAELASRSATLEAELARAKLDALRSQLRPHFLFNTLNAISVLAAEDAGKTRQMLLRLSSLLRRSLDEEAHEVSVRQELAFLDDYLDIQRVRFGDRLTIRLAVDPAALNARVPVFLLQPLMENAIEHGKSENKGTTIALCADRAGEMLHVTLEDDGPGIGNGTSVREGIGLRNTRARLNQLYGSRATVELRVAHEENGAAGTRVDIWIPFSAAPE